MKKEEEEYDRFNLSIKHRIEDVREYLAEARYPYMEKTLDGSKEIDIPAYYVRRALEEDLEAFIDHIQALEAEKAELEKLVEATPANP